LSDFLPLLNLVSTLAIVAGLIFAGWQVRLAQQQRARDSAIQLMQSFRTPEFVAGIAVLIDLPDGLSRTEIRTRLGDKFNSVLLMLLSLESVGILVQKREIPLELVEDFFTGPTLLGWRKMEKYIHDLRKEMQMDTPMEYFQFLAEQMLRRQKAHLSAPAHIAHRDWKP
jgi:hypothetical protein